MDALSCETLGWEALEAALDRAWQGTRGGVLACDGDGTLWRPDLGDRFVLEWLQSGRVGPAGRAALVRLCRRHGLSGGVGENGLTEGVLREWRAGRLAPWLALEAGLCLLAGATVAELRAHGAAVVAAAEPALLPAWGRLAAWAERRGVAVHVVSAGDQAVAEVAAARLGIPPERVHATRGAVAAGRLTGAPAGPLPVGPGKVAVLRAAVGSAPLVAAFGDDLPDRDLLEHARLGVAVSPRPALRAGAPHLPVWCPWSAP